MIELQAGLLHDIEKMCTIVDFSHSMAGESAWESERESTLSA